MPQRWSVIPLLLAAIHAAAQVGVPVNGPHDTAEPVHAFVNATMHPSPGVEWRNATLLVQGERILAAGAVVDLPQGAIVHDLAGAHVWPALVDPWSDLGMPGKDRPLPEPSRGAHYWNPAVRPSRKAAELFVPDEERATKLREQGVGAVLTHMQDGIARGTGSLVLLAGRNAQEDVLVPEASAYFSFRKGTAAIDYPSSLMGSIALVRQMYYDAEWYAGQGRSEQSDVDLAALNASASLPRVFEAANRNDVMRIGAIGREFGVTYIVKGNGDEYLRIDDIRATGQALILPLTLPEAFDVEDPFEAMEVSLQQLKHWELAPYNAGMLQRAGIRFAFTLQGLKEPKDAWGNLRRMVQCGLDSTAAIAALTSVPAELLGISAYCGTLDPGKLASFLITSDHLLDPKNRIHETWVAGRRFAIEPRDRTDLRGSYDLNLRDAILALEVKGTVDNVEATVKRSATDTTRVKAALSRQGALITLVFNGSSIGMKGPVRLNGVLHGDGAIWDGQGQLAGGEWIAWSAVRQVDEKADGGRPGQESASPLDSLWRSPPGDVWYPAGAFGSKDLPDTGNYLFRHATVWTNGPQGIQYDTDVCIHQGRIKAVGKALDVNTLFPSKEKPAFTEIDAKGKHLTCGIIDEHSHLGIERGVNEGGQAVSAEVRVGDVIDPDNVNLYRDLAGGVTAIQALHGSANPIGGQSALLKLRWGLGAEAMRIDSAAGFIKFALGENVKQSTSESSGRYPRTRMGVEQIMFDAFHRAGAYDREWQAWRASQKPPARRSRAGTAPPAPSPRRDLELDALAEILRGKRSITCHSYVQSEILMLMRLADSLHFKVNTFTHILEGYKVAAKMKEHGVSASTFSDWWAYKFEVYDAIPYNAALLHDAGVNVCINSDDAEMSRRLNQEAAKTMKYGGMSEQEAWKMVTLNPAKALHLDHRMGSVEPGKDADLVLWSTNPLSIGAKCEMTLVDGVVRFDRSRDAQLRVAMSAERERLVQKMLAAKKGGAPVKKAERRERREYHCDTLGE